MSERGAKVLSIDVTNVHTGAQLHELLGKRLGFPAYYGHNWDAFDAGIRDVEGPLVVRIKGFNQLRFRLPRDAEIWTMRAKDLEPDHVRFCFDGRPMTEPPLIAFSQFASRANAEALLAKLAAAGIPAEILASDGQPVTTEYAGKCHLWIGDEQLDEATEVFSSWLATLPKPLEPVPEIEASWLGGLSPTQRALFLMMLSHELTLVGRMLASPKDPAEVTVERLRQLNETQHRVVAYACYALTPKEDKRFLPGLVKLVLGGGWGRNREAILRDAAARSWVHARNSFSSEIWTF